MKRIRFNREKGQALIMVALMVVVLFGFVALALDMGHVYGGRRHMQNAADAGALAGAREICFGGHDDLAAAHQAAEQAALDYAVSRNDADTATVEILNNYTVTVVASQTLGTFFAGVIGINTANVRAQAAAMCGDAAGAGGLWPLAFDHSDYISKTLFPCGEKFLVFSSLPQNQDEEGPDLNCAPACCYNDDGTDRSKDELPEGCECKNKCNCLNLGTHFDTDDRGWLRLPDPGEDYPCNNWNCGAALKCFLEYDYPDTVREGACVPGKSGANTSVKAAIKVRIDNDDILQVILYEKEDPLCDLPSGPEHCPGDPYSVIDLGCIKPERWIQAYQLGKWGGGNCATFHALEAIKICDEEPYKDEYQEFCSTASGSSSGALPEDWELRAVSLIRWPQGNN